MKHYPLKTYLISSHLLPNIEMQTPNTNYHKYLRGPVVQWIEALNLYGSR